MSQYEKLDYLIVEAIKNGASKFEAINAGAVKDEATRLHHAVRHVRPHDATPPFRFVDVRLQALRKRGLIVHVKGWGWRANGGAV